MNLRNYLYMKRYSISLSISGIFALMLYLLAARVSTNHIIGIISISFIILIFIYIFNYYKAKSYFTIIYNGIDKGTSMNHILASLPRGYNFETFLFSEILFNTVKQYQSKVSKVNDKEQEYKNYIEQWVHEIKLPISTMNLILDREVSPPNLNEEIDKIEYYVEQVLYYAKAEYVEKDYLVKRINLEESVKNCLKKHKRLFINNKVPVDLTLKPILILSDSKWLEFIISQLLVNAIKYCNKLNPIIKIEISDQSEYCLLKISNNGNPIPPEDLALIFNKGFVGKNGRSNQKSTGIGLYLVKNLVNKLGHSIEVVSNNDYTTFSIKFFELRFF